MVDHQFILFFGRQTIDTNGRRCSWLKLGGRLAAAGFQTRTFFLPNLAPFSGVFFARFWDPRDGPKASDGNHVSA